MQDIASSPMGKRAKSQEELLKLANRQSSFKEEVMDSLPLAHIGFRNVDSNGYQRMDKETFLGVVRNLLRIRPSARLWDIKPKDYECELVPLLVESSEAFKTTFDERALILADEYVRDSKVEGFRVELHNVKDGLTLQTEPKISSLSIHLYKLYEEASELVMPVRIFSRWRTNF